MNVAESKRTRHLVLHVERGEELPIALIRAVGEAESKAASIAGTGIVEAAEISTMNALGQRISRRIDTPAVVVSLSGNVAVEQGRTTIHLFATLAHEGPLGHATVSGHLTWARAHAMDLFVTAFDDLALARQTDEQGFPSTLHATQGSSVATTRMTTPVEAAPAPVAPVAAPAPKAVAREPESEAKPPALTPPARPQKPEDDTELYPEVGDLVEHFHFGECEVISSDGERIRLKQIKDSRVREVSLTMLKIEKHTVDPVTNKRHFKLARKN